MYSPERTIDWKVSWTQGGRAIAFTVSSRRGNLKSALFSIILLVGCRRESEIVAPKDTQSKAAALQQEEARLDATVWRNEVLAQRHEKAFVELADNLRRAADKGAVLSHFEFENILVPRTKGPPTKYDLGIQLQQFEDAAPLLVLTHAAWEKALAQFQASGGNLVQAEWQHEKFVPATGSKAALSEFAFELHGEQPGASNRFIIKGTLAVEWSPGSEREQTIKPRQLTLSHISLLERAGPPGFAH